MSHLQPQPAATPAVPASRRTSWPLRSLASRRQGRSSPAASARQP